MRHHGACGLVLALIGSLSPAFAQSGVPAGAPLIHPREASGAAQAAAPLTLTLQDALARAQKNEPQFLSAVSDAKVAREDRLQARAAILPSLGLRSDYLGTQGN